MKNCHFYLENWRCTWVLKISNSKIIAKQNRITTLQIIFWRTLPITNNDLWILCELNLFGIFFYYYYFKLFNSKKQQQQQLTIKMKLFPFELSPICVHFFVISKNNKIIHVEKKNKKDFSLIFVMFN